MLISKDFSKGPLLEPCHPQPRNRCVLDNLWNEISEKINFLGKLLLALHINFSILFYLYELYSINRFGYHNGIIVFL